MSEIRENISSTSRVLLKGMKSYRYDLGRPPEMWRTDYNSVEYQYDELMARLHLEHRENFRLTYLKPAIDDEFVDLTIPDKPTSGKQKYFLSKKGLQS